MGSLLRDLGVNEAEDKAWPPSEIVEFLGILYDLVNMTISIPDEKLQELKTLLHIWKHSEAMTKNQLQKLAGKLQFAAYCVRPGRVFVSRIYEAIKKCTSKLQRIEMEEVNKDILWWDKYMHKFNGTSIMWLQQRTQVDSVIQTDACPGGLGGFSQNQFFRARFPKQWTTNKSIHITHLEIAAIMIALKLWLPRIRNTRFAISCDNKSVCDVLNDGYSKDKLLLRFLREINYHLAINSCEMFCKHLAGKLNLIPDSLSRWEISKKARKYFNANKETSWEQVEVTDDLFEFTFTW